MLHDIGMGIQLGQPCKHHKRQVDCPLHNGGYRVGDGGFWYNVIV